MSRSIMRFSILNLLLLVTTTAAIVALYVSRKTSALMIEQYKSMVADYERNLAESKAVVKNLQQQLGFLTIVDASKINAVKLRTDSEKTWSYRVYLPEGRNYFVATQINALPRNGQLPSIENPPNTSTISRLAVNSIGIGVGPGEYVVTLSVHPTEDTWRYNLNVRKSGDAEGGSTGGSKIEGSAGNWPSVSERFSQGGVFNQEEFSTNRACLLLDYRALSESDTLSSDSDQGAMLWVGSAGIAKQ